MVGGLWVARGGWWVVCGCAVWVGACCLGCDGLVGGGWVVGGAWLVVGGACSVVGDGWGCGLCLMGGELWLVDGW